MAAPKFQILISTTVLLASTGVAVGFETPVNIGDSLTINCSSTGNTTGNHIWWFNEKIIFVDKFMPKDIGVENVRGEFRNRTSYLHFIQVSMSNAGNYSCFVGDVENCFYTLRISVPPLPTTSAYLLCMNRECPTILLLNTSMEYEFQCYTDAEVPQDTFLWKINDMLTVKGVENKNMLIPSSGENVTRSGSTLRIRPRIEDENITCFYGNISRVVYIHVFTEKIIETYLVLVAIPVGSFAIVLFFIVITIASAKHRCSNTNRLASSLQDMPVNNHENAVIDEDVSSFYGNYEDYEDFETYYGIQEMSFYRHQVVFNNVVDIFIKASSWEGTLKNVDKREQDVLISCAPAGVNLEEKYLWEKQMFTKLKLSEHKNILKTLGYCQEEGVTYYIHDYFDVMPLKCFLESDYSNLTGSQPDFMSGSCLKYSNDVINGMSYLYQEKCSHPGLTVKKVLIGQGETCKLHDFCLQNDAKRVLELFTKQDEVSALLLAPENLSKGEYTPASDVWAAGITMWEIFSGEIASSACSRKDDTVGLLTETSLLRQPSGCPDRLYGVMKLCWCTRCEDRPSFEDIKLMLEDADTSMQKLI